MDDACDRRRGDGKNRIMAKDVKREDKGGNYFYCPECNSPVFIKRNPNGIYNNTIFAHKPSPIIEKTEIQKKCPRYTTREDREEYEPLDSYNIAGVIPIYLANRERAFELVAYFPQISIESKNILQKQNARVFLKQNGDTKKIHFKESGSICHNKIVIQGKSKGIIIYPAMWSENNIVQHRNDNIMIPDRLLKVGLPKAWQRVKMDLKI